MHQADVAEVMLIIASFNTEDPPLWTPLLTVVNRREVARAIQGLCLDCRAENCSVRSCPQTFLNTSGALNPAIAQLPIREQALRS